MLVLRIAGKCFCILANATFFTIAIFATKIYEAAGIPVLPVSPRYSGKAKRHIIFHIALFAIVAALLPLTGVCWNWLYGSFALQPAFGGLPMRYEGYRPVLM